MTHDDDDLLDRLDAPDPEVWKPEETGDQIIGTVTGFDTLTSKYGTSPVLVIDGTVTYDGTSTDGLYAVRCGPAVLRRELTEKRDVQIGDRVAVRFLGEVQGRNVRFNDYKVACSPERFRKRPAAPAAEAFDDDGTPFPDEPYDEPGF